MKSALLFISIPLLACIALADTTVQPVEEVSAQQAIIRYRTTLAASTPCSHAITETISGATPDDVNPSIFFGSNLDTRPGSITIDVGSRSGIAEVVDRAFVFGQRTAAHGTDGLIHSRSAKANTAYTDVVTCGTEAPVTVYFTTGNIQNGSTYVEPPPWCPQGFGNWCWPSINWQSQAQQFADPQTGAVIQRVTSPGWWGRESAPTDFDNWSGGSGWSNPADILNGLSGAGATTGNTNRIFVAMSGANFQDSSGTMRSSGYTSAFSYDDFLAALTGSCTSSGANCVVNICLTYWDSTTCNTATQTVTVPGTTGTAGFPASGPTWSCAPPCSGGTPTWAPQFQFGEWGGTPPLRGDFASSYGTVNTNGTTVTLVASGNSWTYFNTKWLAGALIYIAGSGCVSGGTNICTLASAPASQESLTVTETMNTLSGASYYSMASGVLIWKNNATGTVTIGASYSIASSAQFKLLAEGDSLTCNPNSTTVSYAADGATPITPVPGNLCYLQWFQNETVAAGSLFLLIPSTGETRMLSPLFSPAGSNTGDSSANQIVYSVTFGANAWDATDPLSFYGMAPTGAATTGCATPTSTNTCSIIKATYIAADNFKAYSHPLWACGLCAGNSGGGVTPGQDPGVYWYCASTCNSQRWADDPITYTNITPPSPSRLDVYSQIAANNPYYDLSVWPSCGLDRVVQGIAFIPCGAGQQDTMGIISTFNLSTGLIAGWGSSFSAYPARWGGIHTSFQSNTSTGAYALALNPPGASGGFAPNTSLTGVGPHQITPYSMLKSSSFTTDTSMTPSAPLDACPSNPYGITGNLCVTIHTQDVCSHSPSTAEKAKWPCPYYAAYSQISPLAAGDGLVISSNENMMLLSSAPVTDSDCGTDCVVQTWARSQWNNGINGYQGLQNVSTGWTGYAIPPYGNCTFSGCSPGVGVWVIPANATGGLNMQWYSDPPAFEAHPDAGAAPGSGNTSFVQAGADYKVRYNRPLSSQAGSFIGANIINMNPPFYGAAPSITVQSYPSNEQLKAITGERRWFTDWHHMNGNDGSNPLRDVEIPIDAVSYSLVSGTSSVYKFSGIAGGLSMTEANQKVHGLGAYAGRYLFQDISGPSSSISDLTPWQACITLNAGECRAGAAVGDVYLSAPNLPAIKSNCYTDWLTESLPCAMFPSWSAAELVQMDGSQSYSVGEFGRRITMGLTGWGRQYEANTFISESTGQWGMFRADWADGIRSEVFMAKLPPYPPASSIPRNTFVNYPVLIPMSAGFADIEFGYMENGGAQAYYCTSRQDTCSTSGTPFAYPSIETRTLTSCSSGCTINLPAIAGRAVYYRVGWSGDGLTWTYGAPQVGLVQ
jgi:hypothetical protein